MLRHIKLYARELCSWKSENEETAKKEIAEFVSENIKHQIQMPQRQIIETKRKNKPLNVEVNYYDLKTIKEIAQDLILKQNENLSDQEKLLIFCDELQTIHKPIIKDTELRNILDHCISELSKLIQNTIVNSEQHCEYKEEQ